MISRASETRRELVIAFWLLGQTTKRLYAFHSCSFGPPQLGLNDFSQQPHSKRFCNVVDYILTRRVFRDIREVSR